jgi:hypothetical protein
VIDRTKAALAGGAVVLTLGFGALGTAMAQDDATPTPTPTPREQQQAPQDRGDRPGHPCPEEGQGGGQGQGGSQDQGSDSSSGTTEPVLY